MRAYEGLKLADLTVVAHLCRAESLAVAWVLKEGEREFCDSTDSAIL